MSMNLAQVFAANPVTTVGATDTFYLAATNTTDAAITGANLKAAMSPLTTKGDLFTYSTLNVRLAVGATNGQVLQVASGAATGLAWSTPTYPSASGTAGFILRSNGTNNVYSQTTYPDLVAANAILFGSAANTVGPITPAASSVLVSSAGSVPSWGTTLPAGLIIPGYTSFTFTNVVGATQTIVANNGYTSNNPGSSVAYTMPATAAVGTVIEIVGSCSGGWNIIQLANQIIHDGNVATTTGAGGSVTTTNRYDCIRMVCIVADLEWSVTSSQGSFTIV